MLKSIYTVEKNFTKLKYITKFFDKSNFSNLLKICKTLYIQNVYNVQRQYTSNKREIIQYVKKCLPRRETYESDIFCML